MVNLTAGRLSKPIPFISSDFPEKCRTTFNAHIDNVPSAGLSIAGVYKYNSGKPFVIKGNDIFDPEGPHGTPPVRNHAIWATLYTKYNVSASRLTGYIRPTGIGPKTAAATGSATLIVIIPQLGDEDTGINNATTPTQAEYDKIRNHPLAKIYRYDHHANIPSRAVKIDVSCKTFDILDYYDHAHSDDHAAYIGQLNTAISAAPATAVDWYWHIYLLADSATFASTSSNTLSIELNVDVTYYTKLLGQKTVG